ncbi:MAG: ImuA family protein [Pseudomonadota bacterium]
MISEHRPQRSRRPSRLPELRAKLDVLEGRAKRVAGALALGLPAIDRALPWGGLPRGCLHEVAGEAGVGFCLALLRRFSAHGPVMWIARGANLYAPGLMALGLDPARLLVVEPRRRADILWALEEALRTPALAAALAETEAVDFIASRRLQLAAEGSGVTAFILRSGGAGEASAARTAWRIAALPSVAAGGGVGAPRWRVALERCRGGASGTWPRAWNVEWRNDDWHEAGDRAPGDVGVAAASGDRSAGAGGLDSGRRRIVF